MANLLKGKDVAISINERSKKDIEALKNKGIIPTLAIVRVGSKESDLSYEKGAIKRASEVGVEVKSIVLDENVDYNSFYSTLDQLNNDNSVHGILLLRPIPNELDNEKARLYIKPEKDVDGCGNGSLSGVFTNTEYGFAPCTAQAAIEILDYYNIDVTGKNVVVVGRSLVVGKPLSMLLLNKNATVTVCHSKTKDLPGICKKADIVICAIGRLEMLNADYFSNNQIVIDVGINWSEAKQKLCGDVLFEEAEPIVDSITPVPGGVGSVTTSVLINHVVEACKRENS